MRVCAPPISTLSHPTPHHHHAIAFLHLCRSAALAPSRVPTASCPAAGVAPSSATWYAAQAPHATTLAPLAARCAPRCRMRHFGTTPRLKTTATASTTSGCGFGTHSTRAPGPMSQVTARLTARHGSVLRYDLRNAPLFAPPPPTPPPPHPLALSAGCRLDHQLHDHRRAHQRQRQQRHHQHRQLDPGLLQRPPGTLPIQRALHQLFILHELHALPDCDDDRGGLTVQQRHAVGGVPVCAGTCG